MKILLVNDYGTATGGAEHQILALRSHLRKCGHDAHLFSSRARHVSSKLLADYSCFGTTKPRLQVLTQTLNPSAYWEIRRVLKQFRPDVVHIRLFLWQLSPAIMALLRNVPTLYQAVMYKAICPMGTKILPDGEFCHDPAGRACLRNDCVTPQTWAVLMLQLKLLRKWYHIFDLTTAVSGPVKDRLEREGIVPVEVVHNSVRERPIRPPLSNPPTVAYAGRLAREKGVDILIRAFARLLKQLPEAKLLIAGDGPDRANCHRLIEELGLFRNVILLGHLPRPEMDKKFEAAWVQAVPSLWEDPFPNVTTEAMIRGTAVIGSNAGGMQEIIRDRQTGFLVTPGNIEVFTAALMKLLKNRALAEEMGKAGHEIAITHFSEAACTGRFLQLYQKICRNKTT